MKSVHEGEPILITGRKPALLTRRELLGLGTLGALGLLAFEQTRTSTSQDYNAYLDEKAKTGGYLLKDVTPSIIQVALLDSGKYQRPNPTLGAFLTGGGVKDIRGDTLAMALSKLEETYEIVNFMPIEDTNGGTSGMLVQVKNK